ncbi:DUF202 domain-containing protein [Microbacterium schleiferi]|jgi:putative membrane protein|uniref:DUF202 domain-containing protein n=1 Tax=Microbacterium schleiferi TaxID=69362 RepID=A0A7S8MY68_9MICO|nr:DUF202 domain-containing protein [Microbacterium schleiferi]QPE04858.1 DUF202 domain-containing protein [Microbacterium schleiferi]
MGTRFPHSVYRHGSEPDVRFTLANERTFLAWIRTALALIAGGVALEVLGLALHPGLRLAASLVLIVMGMITPALAWFGWQRSERALRLNSPLPGSLLGAVTGVAVTVSAALILLAIVFA